jgi:hypothetical protein
MVTIKGLKKQTDCKKCPLMGKDGNPKDLFSPMMCVAIWATTHEIKHCVGGEILNDCPLVEIGTCKDCKHRDPEDKKCDCGHSIVWQTPRPDNWYCADYKKRGSENE